VLTTTLDTREVKFLIHQIDESIQVTEFMIRKTPSLDRGELAFWPAGSGTMLTPTKQIEQEGHRGEGEERKN
jgi:hypothetical protein